MNWLYGNQKKKTSTSLTNLENQKTRQIESLQQVKGATIKEIIRFVEYRIIFAAGTTTITLIISLASNFPDSKPVVTVEPPVQHPWVNEQMEVAYCPALIGFTMHSSLGTAVQAVVDEFKTSLPRHSPVLQPPHITRKEKSFLTVSSAGSCVSSPAQSFSNIQKDLSAPVTYFYSMPAISSFYSALESKSFTELNELLNDDDKLEDLIKELPEMKKVMEDKTSMTKACEELARENLSKKPVIDHLREELRTGIADVGGLQSQVDLQHARYVELSHQYSLTNISSNLKVAILEAEEESESVASSFLSGNVNLNNFCSSFLNKRSMWHRRRAKDEKLQQMMRSGGYIF